jgi:Skp family chaperone for outer membrane proteins
MKTTHFYWLALCALATTAVIFSTGLAQQAPVRLNAESNFEVGICNVVTLFKEYDRAEAQLEALEKAKNRIETENQRRQADLKQIQQFMKGLTPGSKGYEEQYELLRRKTIQAELVIRSETEKIMRSHQMATREIYNEILDGIETVARKKGMSMVLYANNQAALQEGNAQEMLRQIQGRRILYSAPETDITTEVLILLNRNYKNTN